jgi:hypothetical protein
MLGVLASTTWMGRFSLLIPSEARDLLSRGNEKKGRFLAALVMRGSAHPLLIPSGARDLLLPRFRGRKSRFLAALGMRGLMRSEGPAVARQ